MHGIIIVTPQPHQARFLSIEECRVSDERYRLVEISAESLLKTLDVSYPIPLRANQIQILPYHRNGEAIGSQYLISSWKQNGEKQMATRILANVIPQCCHPRLA